VDLLSQKDKIALQFLAKPATSREVAEHLGIPYDSVYGHLRLLQRLGLIEKVGRAKNQNGHGRISIFKATGATEIVVDPDYVQIAAHNPFNLQPMGVCHA
jgi:predicted ArsR family transcriptional regulator